MKFKFKTELLTLAEFKTEVEKVAEHIIEIYYKNRPIQPLFPSYQDKITQLEQKRNELLFKITKVGLAENPRAYMSNCWKSLNQIREDVTTFKNNTYSLLEIHVGKCADIPTNAQKEKEYLTAVCFQKILNEIVRDLNVFERSLMQCQKKLEDCSYTYATLFSSVNRPLNNLVGKFNFGTFGNAN